MSPMNALTLKDLAKKTRSELDSLYRSSEAGPIPQGNSRGQAIFFPGTLLTGPMALLASGVWGGKVFNPANATLLNKVLGLRLFNADVYKDKSWRDGKPSVIIDYSKTSRAVGFVRDEIRKVAPDLYLGIAYLRTKPKPTFGVFFALDFQSR